MFGFVSAVKPVPVKDTVPLEVIASVHNDCWVLKHAHHDGYRHFALYNNGELFISARDHYQPAVNHQQFTVLNVAIMNLLVNRPGQSWDVGALIDIAFQLQESEAWSHEYMVSTVDEMKKKDNAIDQADELYHRFPTFNYPAFAGKKNGVNLTVYVHWGVRKFAVALTRTTEEDGIKTVVAADQSYDMATDWRAEAEKLVAKFEETCGLTPVPACTEESAVAAEEFSKITNRSALTQDVATDSGLVSLYKNRIKHIVYRYTIGHGRDGLNDLLVDYMLTGIAPKDDQLYTAPLGARASSKIRNLEGELLEDLKRYATQIIQSSYGHKVQNSGMSGVIQPVSNDDQKAGRLHHPFGGLTGRPPEEVNSLNDELLQNTDRSTLRPYLPEAKDVNSQARFKGLIAGMNGPEREVMERGTKVMFDIQKRLTVCEIITLLTAVGALEDTDSSYLTNNPVTDKIQAEIDKLNTDQLTDIAVAFKLGNRK